MFLFDFFKKIGNMVMRAVRYADSAGLDDALISTALSWVKVAAAKFTDNSERREFVVKMLLARGIPESVARLALELAVRLYKKEVEPKLK